MPANKNALIRYKTIDRCLSNHYRRWTLDDLIEACNDALYEYEGITKGISRRTLQNDLAIMRSDKLGYNAPIEVYDGKYYRYTEPDYTIVDMPLSEDDVELLNDTVGILGQFAEFGFLGQISDIVARLDNHIYSYKKDRSPRVCVDTNPFAAGLQHINHIYRAICERKVLDVNYKSFRSPATTFVFSPYFLKEYNNRWFVIGKKDEIDDLSTVALDRIESISIKAGAKYDHSQYVSPEELYANCIGVTLNREAPVEDVVFDVADNQAHYLRTKPLHRSQTELDGAPEGMIRFRLHVRVNMELVRELRAFGSALRIVSPPLDLF